jgi:hypothetical protein
MPIKEIFIIETTPGIDPIPFDVWLARQSPSEQDRYHQARARADAYRQEAIDAGLMIHVAGAVPGAYIWRDEAAKKQGKRQDNECMDFYARFNADTGRKLVTVVEHVNE